MAYRVETRKQASKELSRIGAEDRRVPSARCRRAGPAMPIAVARGAALGGFAAEGQPAMADIAGPGLAYTPREAQDVPMEARLPDRTVAALRQYLSGVDVVAFSVLFGSAARGRLTADSDVDIGVYLAPSCAWLEVEDPDAGSPRETEIWTEVEHIVGRTVDLVVLNRAASGVAAEALRSGRVLSMRDPVVYTKYHLAVSDLAESFRSYVGDFVRVRGRSRSLSEVDRSRLERILDFLERELDDTRLYGGTTRERYLSEPFFRRSIERWLENLVNASIDISKVLLAASGLPMPETYRESLGEMTAIPEFAPIAARLARNAVVRNVLAHEYLDVRFTQVRRIADEAAELYGALLEATRHWVKRNAPG